MVVSNDAGSTEYISHLILNEKNYKWTVYALVNSIASLIFKKYNIIFNLIDNIDELSRLANDNNPNIILYGTGWEVNFSSVVKDICIKNNNIKSIGLIDHWSNYAKRFNENALPDTIVVMDDLANRIARETFGDKVNIVQTRNYFIENMHLNFSLIENKVFDSIVFISQPTVVNKVDLNAYEYTLVEKLLTIFDTLIIRLHPSEGENKYNSVISKFPKVNVKLVKPYEEDLLITLSKSKLTIGIGSMALYISHVLNINTVSCLLNSDIKPDIPIPDKYILKSCEDLEKIAFSSLNLDNENNNVVDFDNIIHNILKR